MMRKATAAKGHLAVVVVGEKVTLKKIAEESVVQLNQCFKT